MTSVDRQVPAPGRHDPLLFSPARVLILLIVTTAAARIVIAAVNGLGIDEAYSVGNARILSLAYVDHPPLHLWIAGLAARLAGSEAALVVRLPFIALFAGSTWLMFRLGRVLYGEEAGLWAAIWLNLAPVFGIVHAGGVLPDGPLIFFLLAAANVLADICFTRTARPMLAWPGVGVLAGLALLSKYSAVFFCLGTFVYLLTVPRQRPWLATAGPWLALLAAALVFSPAIVWNAEHGLASFAFQGNRAAAGAGGGNVLRQIGGQMLYLSPWLFVPFAIALVRSLVRGPRDERAWFLAMLAIGPIAVFTTIAIWSPGLPHWPMPGWLFALALPPLTPRRAFLRAFAAAAGVVSGLVALAFAIQGSGLGIPHATLQRWKLLDPTVDLVDWKALPETLAARGLLGPGTHVAAPEWRTAGKASYALGPTVPVFCLCADPHHFPFREDPGDAEGRDVLLVWPATENPDWRPALADIFDRVEPLPPIAVTRAGETVLTLDLSLGRNFHRSDHATLVDRNRNPP